MNASFRRVREQDLKRLNDIVNEPEVAVHLALNRPVRMSDTRRFFEANRRAGTLWYGIWAGELLVGSCSMARGRKGTKIEHLAELGISIDFEHWGMGFGDAAMDHMVRVAKRLGLKRLELLVEERNLRAQALYRRHGFTFEGVKRRGYRSGRRYYDMYLMGRLL